MENTNDNWATLGQWTDVAAGLRLFIGYMITLIAFTTIVLVATIAVAMSGKSSAMSSVGTIAKIASVIGIGIAIFGLIALERYSRIAPETGARGTAKTALYLGIAGLVISLISIVQVMTVKDITTLSAFNVWDLIVRLLSVVQFFCFLASMRTCASFIGHMELYDHAGKTMTILGITIALAVVSQMLAASGAGPIMLLFALGMLGIGIWCVVYIFMLLSRLARAVSRDAHLPATFS